MGLGFSAKFAAYPQVCLRFRFEGSGLRVKG